MISVMKKRNVYANCNRKHFIKQGIVACEMRQSIRDIFR